MGKIILFSLFFCMAVVVNGNPVKKSGVIFEELVESLGPDTTELNGSDEATIVINFDSSESEYKEIPLDFLAKSLSGENDDDGDSSSEEEASVSGELLNPAIQKIEDPVTAAADSYSDETGTCVDTTIKAFDSDENGTCPPTTEDESDSESDEVPKIIIKKTIIMPGEESSSSEPADMIINPFVAIPNVEEIMKPKLEESHESMASDELEFNLIDSNDIVKHTGDITKNVKEEERSILSQRFTSFIDALMNVFTFA